MRPRWGSIAISAVLISVVITSTITSQTREQHTDLFKSILKDVQQHEDTTDKVIKFDYRIFKWDDRDINQIALEYTGRHDPIVLRTLLDDELISGIAFPAIKEGVALHDTSGYGPCNVVEGEIGIAFSNPKFATRSYAQVLVLFVNKRRDRFGFQQYLYSLRRERGGEWTIEERKYLIG